MVEPNPILFLIPITECSIRAPLIMQPSATTDLSIDVFPVILEGGKTLALV